MDIRNRRPQGIDVVILCGGLGKRLQGVIQDRPKPMAEIQGSPFLDILIDYVARHGFTRFILCAGYKGDFVKKHYEHKKGKLVFLVSMEDRPLGTAGAIKNAESFIKSDPFLVLNGDSLCEIDLEDFLRFHVFKKAFLCIALTPMRSPADYGLVTLDEDHKVIRFNEKLPAEGTRLVNAGIYLCDRKMLEEIPSGEEQSLEVDLLPRILDKGIYGYITEKILLDIGTPERLKLAGDYFREMKK